MTTYDPVSIEWICSMPRRFRIAFVQGIADSDGYVHLSNQEVHLIVSPNLRSIKKILDSLEVVSQHSVSKGLDVLKIRHEIAASLPVFNPSAKSYRYSFLLKLAGARRLRHGPWPEWLAKKITRLLRDGLSTGEIQRRILRENDIAIRATSVRRRRERVLNRQPPTPGVLSVSRY